MLRLMAKKKLMTKTKMKILTTTAVFTALWGATTGSGAGLALDET